MTTRRNLLDAALPDAARRQHPIAVDRRTLLVAAGISLTAGAAAGAAAACAMPRSGAATSPAR